MSTERYRCDNCRKIWQEAELKEIKDYFERVEPGGEVPAGECPSCGALSYLVVVRDPQPLEVNGKTGPRFLQLGIQTNPGTVFQVMHWKACVWAPKEAKSYNILAFWHTDYDDHVSPVPTGYATFRVEYYSHSKDGIYPLVDRNHVSPWYHGGPSWYDAELDRNPSQDKVDDPIQPRPRAKRKRK